MIVAFVVVLIFILKIFNQMFNSLRRRPGRRPLATGRHTKDAVRFQEGRRGEDAAPLLKEGATRPGATGQGKAQVHLSKVRGGGLPLIFVGPDDKVEDTKAKVKCGRTRLQDRMSTDKKGTMVQAYPCLTRSGRCSGSSGRTPIPISVRARLCSR